MSSCPSKHIYQTELTANFVGEERAKPIQPCHPRFSARLRKIRKLPKRSACTGRGRCDWPGNKMQMDRALNASPISLSLSPFSPSISFSLLGEQRSSLYILRTGEGTYIYSRAHTHGYRFWATKSFAVWPSTNLPSIARLYTAFHRDSYPRESLTYLPLPVINSLTSFPASASLFIKAVIMDNNKECGAAGSDCRENFSSFNC